MIHIAKNGDYIFIGTYTPKGVLKTMGLPDKDMPTDGESAVRFPAEYVATFFLDYAAKRLMELKSE